MQDIVKAVSKWFLSHYRSLILVAIGLAFALPVNYGEAFVLPIALLFVGSGLVLTGRKLFYPNVDMQKHAKSALEDKNMASAIVFLSGVLLVIGFLIVFAWGLTAPFLAGGKDNTIVVAPKSIEATEVVKDSLGIGQYPAVYSKDSIGAK